MPRSLERGANAGGEFYAQMPANPETEFLELPTRDRVRVFIEGKTVKISQDSDGGSDDLIYLSAEDALRVADALKIAAAKMGEAR